MKKEIIVITGLTASGKTKISIELAKKLNCEIICADSRIIYKGLDIVSAKPTKEEQQGIKHHLIDIITPDFDFSAGDFVSCALKIINSSNKPIIISGGTWFYIKSLLDEKGLIECPTNPILRQELEQYTNEELFKKLEKLDIQRANKIHPNNRDKVIRSIEMCIELNKPISQVERPKNQDFEAKWFMPYFEREEIYKRIEKRTDEMISMGLFEEWQKNKEIYGENKILKNTIGYKEFYELEEGIYKDFEEAVSKIKQHTRNFAKRQMTYFKSRNDINFIKSCDDILKSII